MNREIKFTAWDGSRLRDWQSIKECLGFHHWLYDTPDGVILMQYTGLKDKNGKEIYEGDICEEWKKKGQIKWGEHGGWILDCGDLVLGIGALDPDQMEVIGNIYENPELLEQ